MMNKKIIIVLIVLLVSFIFMSGCATQLSEVKQMPEETPTVIEAPPPETIPFASPGGLGELCSEDECNDFCQNYSFPCEVYCVQHPENRYCQERFSFVYTIEEDSQYVGYPLMRFPEFREYPYVFKNRGLQEEEPRIKHIGVEIDFYDPKKNKAGDFVFNKFTYSWNDEVYNSKVFYDYGSIVRGSDGMMKQVPEVAYIVPLGTKVHAMADGIVVGIKQQEDTGDYEMNIVTPESPSWTFGYDHLDNLLVKEGDSVLAGQVLGEVSDFNQWLRQDGFGTIEVALAFTRDSFIAHCPFLYLDESVKEDYYKKINALYKSWEKYTGNNSLYEEDKYVVPGCAIEGPLEE